MALRVCMIDLADSCFKGVKLTPGQKPGQDQLVACTKEQCSYMYEKMSTGNNRLMYEFVRERVHVQAFQRS